MKPNKLNKILTLLFIFMCSMMLLNDQVKATSSGGSIGGKPGSGGGGASGGYYRVTDTTGYRVTLVKYETGSNEPIDIASKTYIASNFKEQDPTTHYYTSSGSKASLLKKGNSINWNSFGGNFSTSVHPADINVAGSDIGPNLSPAHGMYDWSSVVNYFANFTDPTKTAELQNYLKQIFNFDIENGNTSCEELKYYYLLIEPMQVTEKGNGRNSGIQYFGTISELNAVGKTAMTSAMSTYIFTPTTNFSFENINVSFDYLGGGVGNNPDGTTDIVNLTNRNAYGVGIIWIGTITQACKKCYKIEKNVDNPVCRNSDRNNIGTYKEIYTETQCDSETEKNTEYGKLIKETNDCNIYCIESATTNFPGSISSKLSLNMVPSEGAYFAWPTMRSRNGLYTMSMTSKFTCRIVRKGNSCDTNTLVNTVKSKIESNEMKFGAKLTAGTNRKINIESLVKDGNPIDKSNTSGASNFSNNVSGEITFERTQYLKINGSTNRYYNRVTDATSDSKPNSNDNLKNIFDRKQGVVSLKKNDDTNNDYKLVLSNISLGSNNIFGTDDAYSYVCSYAITNDSCLCPEGSPKSEFDIYHELTEEELKGKTCSQLQQEYCYDNSGYYCVLPSKEKKNITTCVQNKIKEGLTTTEAIDKCTEEDPDCKNICQNKKTGELVNIEDCMNRNNNNYAFCENVYCRSNIPCETCCVDNGDNCEWVKKDAKLFKKKCVNDGITYDDCEDKKFSCPGGEENMKDPTTCFTNGLKGTGYGSIEAALNAGREDLVNKIFHSCQIEVCPSGKKIIYRVIDLNDPFPGKTGNKKTGLTGFSNTGGRSRKPGSNWNSTELVNKKILNARGAKGYKLYTEKQPLYKITLTPSIIKEIRKYNKSTNYSDFTLNCTGDNKNSKCISKFIHEELKQKGKNVVEGLCASITNSGEFDECYGGGN